MSTTVAEAERPVAHPEAPDATDQLIEALEALLESGDALAAIRQATARNRASPDGRLERKLAEWRHRAFAILPTSTPRADWPPAYPDPFPGLIGVPEIEPAALTTEMLGGAILHHGSLLVRGLLPRDQATALRANVDLALDARDAKLAGAPDSAVLPWYAEVKAGKIAECRPWTWDCGAIWTADSPRNLAHLIDLFESTGIVDLIAGYFGERPALSIGKSTLRRVPVTTQTDWHQDGAFLGPKVRSVNLWLALSPCGEDAAGLDIVGRRLSYVMQSGSHGAAFHWSCGPGLVDILARGGAPIVSPVFEPGDALLFDHLMLHRTGIHPGMTQTRWALENWFFAPSSYPMDQEPLVI
jgi:hypothetical protein